MNLLWKCNILLFAVFGVGLAVIAVEARSFLQRQADDEVLREAGLISASAYATRQYTANQVGPLLEKTEEHKEEFLPQTIPFYAATQTFAQLRKQYPDFTYREAALNPTNVRDRATDWENDIINYFRNEPNRAELIRTREAATGPLLYVAHPIRMAQACVECHSDPSSAPAGLVKRYGSQNGFGWNVGEVIGAQIIAIPASVPQQMARRAFRELMMDLSVVFLLGIVLMDAGLYFIVVRPLRRISTSADRISQGDLELEQLNVEGNDEVAQVTRSFNRMHTSLRKAMDLLNG